MCLAKTLMSLSLVPNIKGLQMKDWICRPFQCKSYLHILKRTTGSSEMKVMPLAVLSPKKKKKVEFKRLELWIQPYTSTQGIFALQWLLWDVHVGRSHCVLWWMELWRNQFKMQINKCRWAISLLGTWNRVFVYACKSLLEWLSALAFDFPCMVFFILESDNLSDNINRSCQTILTKRIHQRCSSSCLCQGICTLYKMLT